MHIDDQAHGQDEEFTAAFEELREPADKAGDADDLDQGDAGAKAPAEQPGADKAPEAVVKDPWEGASPELIAERDRLLGERDRYKHSDQSQRGRISALTRTIEGLRTSIPPQLPQDDGDKGSDKGKDAEAETKAERLKALREDYPDLGAPILDLIDEMRTKIEAVEGRVSPVIDANNEAAIQAQERVLGEKHPDWAAIGASQDFAGWASAQPAQIQALCSSFDAAEVSAALSLFKADRDASKPKVPDDKAGDQTQQDQQRDGRRDRQLHGGKERTSRGAPAATGAPDDFEGAFNFFANRRKRQQGR